MSYQPIESGDAAARRARFGLLIWPVAVVLLMVAMALIWFWSVESTQRQVPITKTLLTGVAAMLLLGLWFLIWLLFLSRLRLRTRLTCLGLLAGVALFLSLSLEMKGLTGDVVPILGWRWSGNIREAEFAVVKPFAEGGALGATRSEHDYPQFLGPRRDGSVTEVRLSRNWPESFTPLWRQPVGAGWSGFAVAGAYAVTQEQRGDEEAVTCYDLRSGALRWAHTDEVRWEDPLGGPGPRATPTIVDSRVYSLGGTGVLNVLDLLSGELVWSRNVVEENGARAPTYGVSSSPLIVGQAVVVSAGGPDGKSLVAYHRETGEELWSGGDDRAAYSSPVLARLAGRSTILLLGDENVVVSAGGPDGKSLVAYHRETGEELWSGGDDRAAYSSPVLARLAGRSTILLLGDENVVGHDAADGSVLLSYPWPSTEKVSQVLLLPGERLFLSSGYGVGAKLLGLRARDSKGLEVELVWESRAMKAKFTNVVHRNGYLYGLDDGILACVDAANGERMWKGGRYGHGQVILVHDLLLVLAEDGRAVLVEASPGAHRELGSFAALEGKTWNHPALAGGLLVVRNDREAACYELPLAPDAGSQPGPS